MRENSLFCKTSIFWFSFFVCHARDGGEGTAPWENICGVTSVNHTSPCQKKLRSPPAHTALKNRSLPVQTSCHTPWSTSGKSQATWLRTGNCVREGSMPFSSHTVLTQHPRRPHGLCGDFWAPPASCSVKMREKQLPCRNVYWDQM